ncbi:MAG: DUF4446 domain-containing protein [Firmicutes bacterium HGW-Firmicutes-1]|jgi:hypothetical protein|nr:MAG: DUF4446 domain-containing protein [Firmicutes bacterium HGW-Firmicutes-1]
METVTYLMSNYGLEIIIGTYSFLALLFILLIIQMVKTSKLKKRYNLMFKGEKVQNVEEMLLMHKIEVDKVINTHADIKSNISNMQKALTTAYSKSSIYRYDAFSGLSGKLSFVYVLLDSTNSGLILNGIYSSEGHYLYIKDVVNGKTEKELSKEERLTLDKVMNTNN